ncbi:MAG: signal peptide peptidase SppA [Myxococcales bacterium]|nr:signal peptide peptidase SppA [Myxococcales bacterium]
MTNEGPSPQSSPPASEPTPAPTHSPTPPASPPDRRTLYGALLFGGLILLCFGFAFLLLGRQRGRSARDDDGPRVGVVEVTGAIVSSKATMAALRAFRRDKTVKAVVIRINSPGGSVGPSQEVYRELMRLREKKPVVASMGTVAASGGYYMAAGATKIVANSGTITGSIGVISSTTSVKELLDLARVHFYVFKTGKFKDTGSPLREPSEDDKRYMQALVDKLLVLFVDDIAKGRKMKVAAVRALADGRIFTGAEAKAKGLVDELGNYHDALDLAVKLAKGKGEARVVYHRRQRSMVEQLMEQFLGQMKGALREAVRERKRVETRAPGL